MSLLASLPAPSRELKASRETAALDGPQKVKERDTSSVSIVVGKEPPPYGQRKGFVPRKKEDFGDGECARYILVVALI